MVDRPSRRTALKLIAVGGIGGLAGCSFGTGSERAAHTVSVYLGDREAVRDVTVTVEEADGTVVFEREYRLTDENEARENVAFPAATTPRTVVVTVDGETFERAWPGFEDPNAQCSEGNWAGVDVWIEGGPDESPSVRLEANCQHVTLE